MIRVELFNGGSLEGYFYTFHLMEHDIEGYQIYKYPNGKERYWVIYMEFETEEDAVMFKLIHGHTIGS